jgi:hypothetical protein
VDREQIELESNSEGKISLRTYMTCPVLHSYIHDNEINQEFIAGGLSDYLIGRLNYVLKLYFTKTESRNTNFDEWIEIIFHVLTEIAPSVNKETWRRYKTVLLKVLSIGLERNLAPSEIVNDLISQLKQAQAPTKDELSLTRERSRKACRLRPEEVYLLRLNTRGGFDPFAVAWLEFNLCTGFRPAEIETSQLHYTADGIYVSCINVIKDDSTREKVLTGTLAESRMVSLAHLSMHDIKFIENTICRYRQLAENSTHMEIFTSARIALRDLSKRALGFSVSLSVGRKQFAANQKSMGESPEVLAQRMGHTDVTRARRSYGRTGFGHARKAVGGADDKS